MDEIKAYPGFTSSDLQPGEIVNSLTIKTSVLNREDEILEDKLVSLINERYAVSKSHSSEAATTHFLQVYNKTAIHANAASSNRIASQSKEISSIYDYLFELKFSDSDTHSKHYESCVVQLKQSGLITDVFPMHYLPDKKVLTRIWVVNFFGRQPVHEIKAYFGAEIATYFSWMGFYTITLVLPTLIGMTQRAYQYYYSIPSHSISGVSLIVIFLNFLWVSFFLLAWSSINDTLNRNTPDWEGDKKRRLEHKPDGWIPQRFKQVLSLLLTVLIFVVVVSTSYVILKADYLLKDALIRRKELPWMPNFLKTVLIYLPQVVLSVTMVGFSVLYNLLAKKLTTWENYQYTTPYNNMLMAKLIVFRIFNAFHTLFYIAFVLQDTELLQVRLMNLLIVQQIKGNVGEVFGSSLRVKLLQVLVSLVVCSFLSDGFVVSIEKLIAACGVAVAVYLGRNAMTGKLSFLKFAIFQKKRVKYANSVEKESEKRTYSSTYLDYLEMLIQFGYIFLFSPIYPLASIFTLVNNMVEIHTDAFRLVKLSKRPVPSHNSSGKFWEYGFGLMVLCGVVTNSQLIRNSQVLGNVPFARSVFLCFVAFVAAFVIVRKFLVGVFDNVEDSSKKDD